MMEASTKSKTKKRSYRAIKETFLQLLENKPFDTISIKEICDLSGYSRGTFYSHFLDKYDLINHLVEDETNYIHQCWARYAFGAEEGYNEFSNKPYISQTVEDMFDHVYKNRAFYRIVAAHKLPEITLDRMADRLAAESVVHYQMQMLEQNQELNADLYFNYFAHMQFQHIRWWIDKDFIPTPQYMAQQFVLIHYRDPLNLSFIPHNLPIKKNIDASK